MENNTRGNLFLVACAAPPAKYLHELVELALADGWRIYVIATPDALDFLDTYLLSLLTKNPVFSQYRHPSETKILPDPDLVLVVPATFNTINKWATGIADTLATGILCESLGTQIPIFVVPNLKQELARHPSYNRHVRLLRRLAVKFIEQPPDETTYFGFVWQAINNELATTSTSKEQA